MKIKDLVPANKPRNFVAKNAMKTTSGAGAHKDKKRADKQGDVKHKGKQFDEGVVEAVDADLRAAVISVIQTIYNGAVDGHDMIDDVADELGDYFDSVEQSSDDVLKQAYSYMRDAGADAEGDPEQMAVVAKKSLAVLKQGVAEGEGKTQKYEMMMRNGQVKRFTARDDADAKRIAAGHGAKSVIRMKGNVPGDKIGEQGVAEGSGGAKYKIKSIGKDSKGDYYISPSTGKKVYKQAKVGDHENPKTGEHKSR